MGTSLGYGQGMEYTYADLPQPSQALPLEKLRQAIDPRERQTRLAEVGQVIAADVPEIYVAFAPMIVVARAQ